MLGISIKTATAEVIKAIARQTVACENHGQIEAVHVHEGRAIERGAYFATMLYDVTFADGLKRTYRMRGSAVIEVKP